MLIKRWVLSKDWVETLTESIKFLFYKICAPSLIKHKFALIVKVISNQVNITEICHINDGLPYREGGKMNEWMNEWIPWLWVTGSMLQHTESKIFANAGCVIIPTLSFTYDLEWLFRFLDSLSSLKMF